MSDHRGEDLKGRAKEATGAATGDDDLKREGKVDQASASAKDKLDQAKDKVTDVVSSDDDSSDDNR